MTDFAPGARPVRPSSPAAFRQEISADTTQRKAGELEIADTLFVSLAGDTVEAETGHLWVPESRSEPESRLIRLSFVRFPSTSSAPGPPIVYLAGGPGGSAILTARGHRFPLFMKLREVGDVIAFEQRGTWGSDPFLLCPSPLIYPMDREGTRERLLIVMREWSKGCVSFWRERGVSLPAYNTAESADDLEDLRTALGVEKLDLWGISYGTHLGLAMLRRHPGSVSRAILAGVEGPDHTLKTPGQIQRLLERVDSLAREDERVAAAVPSFLALVDSVLARLNAGPVTVKLRRGQDSSAVTLGAFDVARLTASAVGDRNALAVFPIAYLAMSRGELTRAAQLVAGSRSSRLSAMTIAMDCASGATAERRARIEREAGETLLGDAVNFPFPEICEVWPHAELGDEFRRPLRSEVPTLFISGTLDGRTPPENAEEVKAGFTRGWHLVLDGASHSDDLFLSDPRIGEIMLAFLRGEPPATARLRVPFQFQAPVP